MEYDFGPERAVNHEGSTLPQVPLPEPEPLQVGAHNGAGHNGTSHNGAAPKVKDPSSLFWQQPLSDQEEVNWFVPPLPHREERQEQVVGLLDQLKGLMVGLPQRAWLVHWNYHTRAAAAAAEQVDVEQETERRLKEQSARAEQESVKLDAAIALLQERDQAQEAELAAAQKQFAEAAAAAGLACEPKPKTIPVGRRGKSAPDPADDLHFAPSGINPQCVEDALQNAVPDLDAVAGEHGVSPIAKPNLWSFALTFFMQILAPLVCGFMLALCLGTLVGILELDDFQRRGSGPKFALAAMLGFVIVYLMGELFSNAVHSLTRTLEQRDPASDKPIAPRLRGGMGVAVGLMIVALFLGFAEVVAEGRGIRELHQQQIAKRDRFRQPGSRSGSSGEMPMSVYMIIGTLISGPYLFYKASKAWSGSDEHLREAWLMHQQQNWLESRRARPEVGQAFQLACRVEQLENSLYDTKVQLKRVETRRAALQNPELDAATQNRRKEARAAAVGEALRLQQMVEEIVDTCEPFPQSPQAVVSPIPNRYAAQPQQAAPQSRWTAPRG